MKKDGKDTLNIPRGFSGYFCIGRTYGGFVFERADVLFRVCLGWIAFGFITYDMEQLIGHGSKHIKDHENITIAMEALVEISKGENCEGPGCIYCEGDPVKHPSSVEARIAKKTLENLKS